MAIERERKFVLRYEPDEMKEAWPSIIKQAYLMLVDKKQLRVRIIEHNSHNIECFICYKNCLTDTDREEYEYPIPYEDALELYNSADLKLKKLRYKILGVEIDVYPPFFITHEGIKVVEIEYKEDENIVIPDFCGEEITGHPLYSNINMAAIMTKNKIC